ncbi:MAG: hypothetical protein CM1200mP18_15300 [Gammaproteobacteria bacterium]|nr:MAG: hypothetical protein CM1200mP18_15300 [Gammaproteobacteria bacterium]
MALKRYVTEMGMGVDVHGRDYTMQLVELSRMQFVTPAFIFFRRRISRGKICVSR